MANDAYNSGIRGSEKPKQKEKEPAKAHKVRGFRVEAAANGGRIIHVEHHPVKVGKGKDAHHEYKSDAPHAHGDKEAAKAHAAELIDKMQPEPDDDDDEGGSPSAVATPGRPY